MKTIFKFFILLQGITTICSAQGFYEDDDNLLYTTTKLTCKSQNPITGKVDTISGTAFFFDFTDSKTVSRPYIVTNKHVVQNAISGTFQLTKMNENGQPDSTFVPIELPNFASYWIPHPDKNVDLCIMPISFLVNFAQKLNIEFYYKPFHKWLVPTKEQIEELSVIENIRFIGYPIGLADTTNNLPIIRSGHNATSLKHDYNGKKEFLIDAPCFPGSSGSPVFIYDIRTILNKDTKQFQELKRLYFLGVLYGGPMYTSTGVIVVQTIPTRTIPLSRHQIPANLGLVIKTERLMEFKDIIK